jgi:oligopeptide transport system substrate-binding protein
VFHVTSRRTRSLLLPASLALAACGRADEGPYVGSTDRFGRPVSTLTINNGADPAYLDPSLARDDSGQNILLHLFEGLTTYHPVDLHPTQGVAERWDVSRDGRRYRFHLRREARWSDGKPVTAHDFVYSWRRTLRPSTGSQAADLLYPLLNAEPFNQGRIKAARTALALRREPRADSPAAALAAGTLVRVTGSAKRDDGWVEVERLAKLPSFGAPLPARQPAMERGFALAAELEDGDEALGVRAADAHTLEVELDRPTPYFLDLTSYPTLAPLRRDVIEPFESRGERERWTRPENIVSNGPYVLESWRLRYEVKLARSSQHYLRDRIAIERIVWLAVESPATAVNLYKAGQLDLFGTSVFYPTEYSPIFERARDHRRYPMLAVYWLQLNTKKPPLDDIRVRLALDLAIDKKLLTETISKGGLPATHYVPEVTGFGYSAEHAADRGAFAGPGHDFDPERARALLREAGHPVEATADGYRAPSVAGVEILHVGGDDGTRKLAVAIQDMWRKSLGIEASLRGEEWKVMLADKRSRRFSALASSWGLDYNHPHAILETFVSTSAANDTGWASPDFDEALRAAAAVVDPAESARAYRRAERLAVAGMARIPLYFLTGTTLVKPYVRGYYDNARSIHPLQYAWIDPDWARRDGDRPAFVPLELPPPGRLGAAP